MISRYALIAAAGLLLCGTTTSAKAADLGGGCCADLEERVAELEATTARKGNRVVSLQVYGQVNKALLIWDDGIDSDAFVVDNTRASSRLGFIGKADIKPGLTAGYNMEMEIVDSRADEVNNGTFGDYARLGIRDDGLALRQNYWFIESDKLGRISLGQQNTASSGTSEVVLGNSMRSADPDTGSAMCVRTKAGDCHNFLNSTVLQPIWNDPVHVHQAQWSEDFTANRLASVIRYDSPSIYGFIASASWGADDYADVALRFKKEFGDFRVAGAMSYQWDNRYKSINNVYTEVDEDDGTEYTVHEYYPSINFEVLAGSASVMHAPTGIYAAFAAGKRDYQDNKGIGLQDSSYWYVQGGIERKFLPYGTTTIYGEYGSYKSFEGNTIEWGGPGQPSHTVVQDSEATRIGFGVVQNIDAAAMDLYAQATIWSFEDAQSRSGTNQYEDLSTILIGSRVKF